MSKLLFDPGRPVGRLFYCLISVLLAVGVLRGAPPPSTPPATTTISDVIYRADGTPAAGTLLITWPAFTTADNRAVPAGSMSLAIGSFGVVNLVLVPNQGATPPGTYYKVVMKLNDDATQPAWVGEYTGWSDLLLSAGGDIFPGDAIAVAAPSRGASFTAIIRDVQIAMTASLDERERYRIQFANEAAAHVAFAFQPAHLREPLDLTATTATAGTEFLADLPGAEVTSITSTTVTIDAGAAPPAGGGIEVRRSDFGWGQESDRNLVGRFTTKVFTVTRLSRVVDFYLRQYDASSPPRYSRYSTVLHVDYPL